LFKYEGFSPVAVYDSRRGERLLPAGAVISTAAPPLSPLYLHPNPMVLKSFSKSEKIFRHF